MPSERPKSSESARSEQWEVVAETQPLYDLCQHVYRWVRLRNAAGRMANGVQCVKCKDVERVPPSAFNAPRHASPRGKD